MKDGSKTRVKQDRDCLGHPPKTNNCGTGRTHKEVPKQGQGQGAGMPLRHFSTISFPYHGNIRKEKGEIRSPMLDNAEFLPPEWEQPCAG